MAFGTADGTISTGRPAFEQRSFERRHSWIFRFGPGAAEHDQVEHPPTAADIVVVGNVLAQPAIGEAGWLLRAFRHGMRFHEAFELGARLFGGIDVEGAGNGHAADGIDRHIGAESWTDRKSFDVAVQFARDQPGGFVHRRHAVVVLGRDQDGFHGEARFQGARRQRRPLSQVPAAIPRRPRGKIGVPIS
ncbi:MAG: hypothetical protein WDN48_18680 [Pseudolabrys sp.]